MTTKAVVQAVLELWGGFFCFLFLLIQILERNSFINEAHKREKRILIGMSSASILLLVGDALAWIFRGYPGQIGYSMVRISNYAVFIAEIIIMVFFTIYMHQIFPVDIRKQYIKWKWLVLGMCGAECYLLISNMINHRLFIFDQDNYYCRAELYWIKQMIALVAMFINGYILMRSRKAIKTLKYCTLMA